MSASSALGAVPTGPISIAQLYREHARNVTRWAVRLAGPSLEVDDVVQEVFLVAQRQLRGFRGDSSTLSWLFGITRNIVRDRLRRDRVRRLLLLQFSPREEELGPSPVDVLERRESARLVYRALDRLPEIYRTPFILFEIDGMSGAEIAELLGLPQATVRVRLHRARGMFLKRLRKLERPSREGRA